MRLAAFGLVACLTACSESDGVPNYEELEAHIESMQVGYAQDHWIEMLNVAGEWERTGLIFGYLDDYTECGKAIDGLQRSNPGREYRCVPVPVR